MLRPPPWRLLLALRAIKCDSLGAVLNSTRPCCHTPVSIGASVRTGWNVERSAGLLITPTTSRSERSSTRYHRLNATFSMESTLISGVMTYELEATGITKLFVPEWASVFEAPMPALREVQLRGISVAATVSKSTQVGTSIGAANVVTCCLGTQVYPALSHLK